MNEYSAEDDEVDVEPYEGESDADGPEASEDGSQDDETAGEAETASEEDEAEVVVEGEALGDDLAAPEVQEEGGSDA